MLTAVLIFYLYFPTIGIMLFALQYFLCQKGKNIYIKLIPTFVIVLLSILNAIFGLTVASDILFNDADFWGVGIAQMLFGVVLAISAYALNKYLENRRTGFIITTVAGAIISLVMCFPFLWNFFTFNTFNRTVISELADKMMQALHIDGWFFFECYILNLGTMILVLVMALAILRIHRNISRNKARPLTGAEEKPE